MPKLRRPLLLASLLVGVVLAPLTALAQSDYPNRAVKVLTGFPPGQATDTLGRIVINKLQMALGQAFFVDNKPGAAGIIATQAAMAAPPDGYTLLLTSSGPLAVNPGLYAKLPYDPVKDFVPVGGIAIVPEVLVINMDVPVKDVKGLVALAKSEPGKINYASGGVGVTNHLVTEMFRSTTGIEINHVPYKGGPPALTDLIGGRVQMMFETSVATLPFVKQGKLRALAVSSPERIAAAPELPTIAELGYPGFSGVPWIAIMAPAHTPPAIVAKLNAEINKALKSKDVHDSFVAQGVEPLVKTPEELGIFVKSEIAKWTKAVKDSGAKAE
ncbi:tripartite tricarboxylate transporter substrate binding protein [Variovorax sp. dw_954]|uniref:Bug family tripartite tricarboxylate transporter substrate binding protein n=1 Tax=Variovorax sp. dw_954 TaxID=2720078 RepID=UPI001BD4C0C0|nr:tripartite tricarboxylate transporter substrate binding protein [Variovorax sp. dw_954]